MIFTTEALIRKHKIFKWIGILLSAQFWWWF
jgi:hypothetical protein